MSLIPGSFNNKWSAVHANICMTRIIGLGGINIVIFFATSQLIWYAVKTGRVCWMGFVHPLSCFFWKTPWYLYWIWPSFSWTIASMSFPESSSADRLLLFVVRAFWQFVRHSELEQRSQQALTTSFLLQAFPILNFKFSNYIFYQWILQETKVDWILKFRDETVK